MESLPAEFSPDSLPLSARKQDSEWCSGTEVVAGDVDVVHQGRPELAEGADDWIVGLGHGASCSNI
jgi:hypothetical protein